MHDLQFHQTAVILQFALAFFTILGVSFIIAPYGRHARSGWGPVIPSRWGWIMMESPACLGFLYFFSQGQYSAELMPLILLAFWQFHYIHRTFIFPFRMRTAGKTMPLAIVGLAIVFNCLNAYINATWISHFYHYTMAWIEMTVFWLGAGIFIIGFVINYHADTVLLNLRKPGDTGYRIPNSGLYRYIACPNYFGEIIEWIGWAIMTWSTAGLAFALYTIANLAPRAISNWHWYRRQFPDYPPERKALVPFVI
ncbi:MAG: DUF1295 domain-containing protein [Pseudomonadota bacterium]